MNKRKRKKHIHKMCFKYQDGCGLMSDIIKNTKFDLKNAKVITGKIYNETIFMQFDNGQLK